MNLSLRSSLRLLPLVTGIALGSTGCFVAADPDGITVGVDPGVDVVVDTTPAEVAIDSNATMTTDPGQGTGLFVETTANGHWRVYTSCDTSLSDSTCSFDIRITPTDDLTTITHVTASHLEDTDQLIVDRDGSVSLTTDTSLGLNGVEFDADPGAVIEIDMLLDGQAQPAFVNWVSNGNALQGAPSNPVDFAP